MAEDFKSLFEDEHIDPNYKLVRKITNLNEINSKKKAIYESKLNFRKKSGKFIARHYRLIDKKLVFYSIDNKTKPLGYYDLMDFFKLDYTEYFEDGKSTLYSFSFKRNGKYQEFFSTQQQKIRDWYDILIIHCINLDFNEIYNVHNLLGKGHFATVHKVSKKSNKKEFAAKILKKNPSFESQKSFIRNEVKILKRISQNDYIVKLFEIYENAQELILIFELMEGGDLYEKVKGRHYYTEKEVWLILLQIVKGIEFLHSHCIVHRDIKLQNVLLVSKNSHTRVKIGDFSLAEYFNEKEMTIKCGTPGFMAPEIFSQNSYNEKIDIFSTGIVLYILLSHHIPFKGKNYNEILEKNKKCAIKFRKKDWENKFKTAKHLLKLMLEKNPERRITTKQILTHKFVIKHFYDDSIKEFSMENKLSKELDLSHLNDEKNKEETKHSEIIKSNLFESEEFEKSLISKKQILSSDDSLASEEKMLNKSPRKSNNTLKPEANENYALKSGNSLFISNNPSKSDMASEAMSQTVTVSLKSSFTLFSQKILNHHVSEKRVIGFNEHRYKSKSTSNSKGSSRRNKSSISKSFEEIDIESENSYYEIFQDENPIPSLFEKMSIHVRETKFFFIKNNKNNEMVQKDKKHTEKNK